MFEFNNVHYAIPISYVIGQTVYGMNSHLSSSLALHPVHKYIAKGLIVSLQPQTHTVFVYFDDVDDSIHQLSVTDLAVLFSSSLLISRRMVCRSLWTRLIAQVRFLLKSPPLSFDTFRCPTSLFCLHLICCCNESLFYWRSCPGPPPMNFPLFRLPISQPIWWLSSKAQTSNWTSTNLFFTSFIKFMYFSFSLSQYSSWMIPNLSNCLKFSVVSSPTSSLFLFKRITSLLSPYGHSQQSRMCSFCSWISLHRNKQFSVLLSNTVILVTILTITKMAIENLIPKPVATSLITQLTSKILCCHSENQSYASLSPIYP